MGFLAFYLIAFAPLVVTGVLWVLHREMHLYEALGGAAAGFATAGIMHLIAAGSMTADIEVWSGEAFQVRYRPEWRERYTEHHSETTYDKDGNATGTRHWTTTEYDRHPDRWYAETNIHGEIDITRKRYQELGQSFGGDVVKVKGKRRTSRDDSTMVSGDPYDYFVANKTGVIEPVIRAVRFENRVKAAPSVFSYKQLSEERSKSLPDYPDVLDTWRSHRVLHAPVNIRKWDQMMARLGPEKKANVILVRLDSRADALDLEAKWVGGKKNDLVLTYGDGWSYVFGWTERERVKRELETLLLSKVDDEIIPRVDQIVREHYQIVDWDKFDYLSIEPRKIHYVILIIAMVVVQGGLWVWFLMNDVGKEI